jgi:glycosyltransferase involved in cell wall biosynthesis
MADGPDGLRVLTALGGAPQGGAAAFFVALNPALAAAGVTVHAVLRPNPVHLRGLAAAGIPYDTLAFGGPLDFLTGLRLRAIARKFRPAIVLTFAGRASVHMPRGDYTIVGRLGGYYALRRFSHCQWLIGNSPDVVRHIVGSGWPEERVVLIPNFPLIDDMRPLSRASFGTPEGAKLALAMGRLHRNKGLDILLKAAAQIPELFLWIAGEGPEEAALKRLARELGIEARVRFLGWRTDRAALYRAADVCVYPSREEPFGNVVVEAWSMGTPIVTTATPGPAWLVRNREDAVMVPVEDAGALAAGIRSVVSAPDFAGRLAAAGKKRVAEEFSEAAIVRRYLEFFGRVRPRRG